jgi:hypothetical protein
LQSILEASPNSSVQSELSNNDLYCIAGNDGIALFPDQETILSVKADEKTNTQYICKENFKNQTKSKIADISSNFFVQTLFVNKEKNSLLMGGTYFSKLPGRIEEYDLSSGNLIMTYSNLPTLFILSILKIKNFCFCGFSDYVFEILDSEKRELVYQSNETAIGVICSMELCHVFDDKTGEAKYVLALAGSSPDYSNNKSDLFDITGMFKEDDHEEDIKELNRKKREIRKLKENFLKEKKEYLEEIN